MPMHNSTPKTFSNSNASVKRLDLDVKPSDKCLQVVLGYSKAVQVKKSSYLNQEIILIQN